MEARTTMTRNVTIVPPELSLGAAWEIMRHDRFRHLPVVASGALVGILSDRDLLARATLVDGTPRMPAGTVAEAMSPPLVTCFPNAMVGSLAQQMIDLKIDCIPVVGAGGRVVGIVTSTDLLALVVETQSATILPFEFTLHTPAAYAA